MTDVSQANDSDTLQGGTSGSGNTTADKFKSQFASFKSTATDKARDYAGKGVGQATDALDEAAKFLEDTARTIEEKLGPQYGRYGFSAAETVSGFASSLRGKEVDELVDDARELVRKSPAVAIGAAVAVGFVIARLAKAGAGFESQGSSSTSATGGTGTVGAAAAAGFTPAGTGMTGSGTGIAGSGIGTGTTTGTDTSSTTPTFPA